jgi:SAM-dependent methyltransferase
MTKDHNDYQRIYYTDRKSPRITLERSDSPYVRRHVDEALRRLALPFGSSVLDVGCGLGKYTTLISDAGYRAEGIDLTPALVDEMRTRLPDLPVHVGDVADPPDLLHGRFDGITGFFFLHHVEDLTAVLAGTKRCLAPGGKAVFIEPNPAFPGYYIQIAITPGMTWRGEKGILNMRASALARSARAAGFEIFKETSFGAFPPLLANLRVGRKVETVIERIPGWHRVGAFRLITVQ